jgi:hypothetical protein
VIHRHYLSTARRLGKPAGAVFAVTALAVACGGPVDMNPETESNVSEVSEPLYVKSTVRWPGNIPVCWETSGNTVAGTTLTNIRTWSRDAVTRRWAAFSTRQFTGWGACPSSTTFFNGVRVVVKAGRAHAKGLGTALTGIVQGVSLDTYLDSSGNPDQVKIRQTAVHEFGHVLGFAHEQNRSDTPASCLPCNTTADCTDPQAICVAGHCRTGSNGDLQLGAWDRKSVMNYCAPATDVPSFTDILGMQLSYGKPTWQPGVKANVTTATFGTSTGVAYVAMDGSVRFGTVDSSGTTASWLALSGSNTVAPGGGILMAPRGTTGMLDLFYVDNTGALRVSTRSAQGTWQTRIVTAANVAPPGSRLAVGDSQAHTLDVFFVGNDGAIKQLWSDDNYATLRTISSTGFAAPGAGIAAAPETASRLDVFVVGTNGAVKVVQGNGNSFPNNFVLTDPNLAPSGAPLTTAQVGDGDLNVFLIGNDGAVKNVFLFFGFWFTANASATGFAPANGVVGATPLASSNRPYVFVIANNGVMYNSSQDGSLSDWTPFAAASQQAIAPPGSPIAASSVNSVFSVIHSGLGLSALIFGGSVWDGAPFY